ncbi:NAD(P)/FAD-dependent oxidoreductase [Maribacter algarum]|uniref:NAD(P)/FAD-dependent oxidoreductase n=1 Tax=Maribacter algarum (ex Zhang et al. 2020) TaxID=2578118 RepID=A0A5S3PS93_9FLAO|nr:NAD(P)/FAD-dependent oxidoreductase [Maribacter algarum]TMM57582.1 NAD(P)/FAD-dependent oxidoreductase [Maribacter algarum]
MYDYDVIIVGGGLAGLTAAIHLSQEKHSVLVLEKKTYPHHKVCGEYVSNEIIPYLNALGVPMDSSKAVQIDNLTLSTVSGKWTQTQLPLGGIGISRYSFDHLLHQRAVANDVKFVFESVTEIEFKADFFEVSTENDQTFTSKVTIGAYGKRSPIDKRLNRDFIKQKSGWLGVKSHYEFDEFPENQVALHNFKGGYGGLSKTETGAVNFCYLASYSSFQKLKNVSDFNEKVVSRNPFLNDFLGKATPIFNEPLTIAQISFQQKKSIENHILMCGDTAGLIHPLCGNGMAMAIHSAKIASEQVNHFLKDTSNRKQLETAYEKEWQKTFKKRLWMGRHLQSLLLNEEMSNLALRAVTTSPALLRKLVRQTHGKPIVC